MIMMTTAAKGSSSPKGKEKSKHALKSMNEESTSSVGSAELPWVEKYRPHHLEDVVHHREIISTLRRFVSEGRLPHLLFYGPPGTGKTSTALSLTNEIFPNPTERASRVLELNASDERGINVVREQIKSFAATRTLTLPGQGNAQGAIPQFKIIILDECDAMTGAAQNALRRVMEKFVRNVRFILICNYVGQIIPALQSRCTRFRFSPISEDEMCGRLRRVLQAEGLRADEAAEKAIISLANGDMRRIFNVLQGAAAVVTGPDAPSGHLITEDVIYGVTATVHPRDINQIFRALLERTDFFSVLDSINCLRRERGLSAVDLVRSLFDRMAHVKLSENVRIFLTKHLADIEYQLSKGATDVVQLTALVGAFFLSRTFITTSK